MLNSLNMLAGFIDRYRRENAWKVTDQLVARQWWSTDDLFQYREKKLRELCSHAYEHVPYYSDRLRQLNSLTGAVSSSKDWLDLPIMTKEILKSSYNSLISKSQHSVTAIQNASGGSTGKPVSFLSDLYMYTMMEGWGNLIFSWAGWTPGEMVLHLWGGRAHQCPGFWGQVKTRLSGRLIIPVHTYDDSDFQKWWNYIIQYRPSIIYAYPSVITEFSKWLFDKSYQPQGVKGVFCSAEILFPEQRNIIEKAFECKVYNQYGSREAPSIACECPQGNMHIFMDLNHVEFLDEEGSDSKKIIATPLFNYAQPLLRYDLGDMGANLDGDCPCGRSYPIMRMDIGRKNDHLVTSSGKKVWPSFFILNLEGFDWVQNYQFRQTAINNFELDVELDSVEDIASRTKILFTQILPKLKSVFGDDLILQVNQVRKIKRTSAGKFRHVINEMDF
jgi:phenylacetate-CoA ligase